jgi:ATP-binding cassette subfamily B multidrug efflux pump
VPRLGRIAREQADARSLMTGRITDAYTNIATVKLFSHARREAGFARSAMGEFLGTVHKQMRLVTSFEIVNHALSMALIGATAGATLWLWSLGDVGVGAVAASTAMALRLNGISHWVMWEMAALFENIGTVQDGINTIARPHTVVDRPDAKPLAVTQGDIRFDPVSFAYGGKGQVIDDLSLHIRPGEKIGLVGRSGAGKSTIVNLLLRFYDTEKGRILIDGQDIALATQDSLRAQIGMVTQDTSLLHRSVRENIVYGRPDATDEQMVAAARRAEAHEFVVGLADPKGRQAYDAHVGERGVKLSGGQRQRVAIARVMLKDAPILLLDEATSALDSEVEAAIQQSLYRLMEGKTVVAIAHRLSTIAAMDRLVVLERGRVVEEGDHRTLLARGGLYARLWEHQSGGFLADEPDDDEPGRSPTSETAAEPARKLEPAHIGHDRPTRANRCRRETGLARDDVARRHAVGAAGRQAELRAGAARQRVAAAGQVAREARERDRVAAVERGQEAVARVRVGVGRVDDVHESARLVEGTMRHAEPVTETSPAIVVRTGKCPGRRVFRARGAPVSTRTRARRRGPRSRAAQQAFRWERSKGRASARTR